jgi:DNA-binding XRE family transcriptional regulator
MSGPHALSKLEAIRCVKRHIAREVYHTLMHSGTEVERVDRFSLREAHKSAGLNQAKVAHALGVSPSTVSGFESGRCESWMFAERYSAWVLKSMPIDVEGPGSGS